MKIWPVLGTLLSLVTGSLPDTVPGELEEADRDEPVHAGPSGFRIEGNDFYVRDEDRREAEGWATELTGPAFPRRS
jgi:hypothetical protein